MSTSIYKLTEKQSPLIVSMPHSGLKLPDALLSNLTDHARSLVDTDWHIPQLYDFVEQMDITLLQANYSRYVVDLNRSTDNKPLYPGQASTDVCPFTTFAGEPLYTQEGVVNDAAIQQRISQFWQPYHDQLQAQIERVKAIHGYAVIYDAHSIRSEIPRLFDGTLPDLNLGTANGKSCDPRFQEPIEKILSTSEFSTVINGRFVGGYITRHYGQPDKNVHTIQMEIAQHSYMDEQSFDYLEDKAARLKPVLRDVIQSLI